MIRVKKGGAVFEVKDYLAKLFIRNGFEIVTDEPKETHKAETPTPKRTTRKTTKKSQ